MPDGKDILRRYEFLRNAAATHFSRCDRMAQYISPSRVGIVGKKTVGADQMPDVYDSTAMGAADLFSKYVTSKIISRAQRWYRWTFRKTKGDDERTEADEWLEECTDRALKERGKSNFYAQAPEMLTDVVGFGTGCMMADERKKYRQDDNKKRGFRGLRYQTTKTGRFVLSRDEEGDPNGGWFEYSVSAEAAAKRWGKDALPPEMQKCLPREGNPSEPDRQFDIVHAIYERDGSERSEYKGAKGYRFASCWVEKTSTKVIDESGYKRFPLLMPAWELTPGEVFGRGVGDRAFADIRTVNKLKQLELEDLALTTRPPIIVAHDSVIGNIRIRPAGVTTLRSAGRAVADLMQPFQTGSKPEVANLNEEKLRESIQKLFFVDLLRRLMEMDKPDVTAFQFAKQLELLYQVLGTAYGQLETGFLIPETEAVWSLMYGDDILHPLAFSPPPPELINRFARGEMVEMDVEFSSPFALAQKMGDVDAIRLSYGDAQMIAGGDAQMYQRLIQNFDVDKDLRLIAERRGKPDKSIRPMEDVEKIRDAIQKKQQQEAQMQQVLQGSEALKNAAPIIQATRQDQAA